jgi:protein-arginine kinase activator protein McsA
MTAVLIAKVLRCRHCEMLDAEQTSNGVDGCAECGDNDKRASGVSKVSLRPVKCGHSIVALCL